MSDHTPTPWAVETPMGDETPWLVEAGKEPYEWRCIAMTCADELTLEDAAANAAFIVKAVNNHDALVQALEEIAACFGGSGAARGIAAETLRRVSEAMEDSQ